MSERDAKALNPLVAVLAFGAMAGFSSGNAVLGALCVGGIGAIMLTVPRSGRA